MVLIGHVGDDFWQKFTASPEYHDQEADGLDRYSARILSAITPKEAELIMPNSPPYPPLQQWAKSMGNMHSSPLKLLIHPQFGLWFAFRAVWRFPEHHFPHETPRPQSSPCDACSRKPCLDACPVQAFSEEGFHAQACRDFLHKDKNPCLQHQCLARRACPVGRQYRYHAACGQFFLSRFQRMTKIA